jgi:hypothetical protein
MDEWVGKAASAAAAAIVTVLGAVGVARYQSKPANQTAGAQMQIAINAGFEILSKAMHAEMEGMRQELSDARDAMAGQERTIQELTGEIRNLSQHVVSLEKILRDAGMEVPDRPQVAAILPFEPPEGSGIQKLNQHVKSRRKT